MIQCFFLTVDICIVSLNGSYATKASVSIGDSVEFQCTCLNSTVQWKLDGDYITTNNHSNIDVTNDTLTIPAARSSDSGNYTCDSNSEYSVSLTVESNSFIAVDMYLYFNSSKYYHYWSVY